MNVLIILLGSHVQTLLNDRINSAVNAMNAMSKYATSIYEFENELLYSRCSVNEPNVTWFLSAELNTKNMACFKRVKPKL